MIIKKIILVSISLLLYSSFAFAYDLEGKWETSGFVCRLPKGEFKDITDIKESEYIKLLYFNGQNSYAAIEKYYFCIKSSIGIYVLDNNRLDMAVHSYMINTFDPTSETKAMIDLHTIDMVYLHFSSMPCEMLEGALNKWYGKRSDFIYNVILNNDKLYLEKPNILSSQCSNGTIFQELIKTSHTLNVVHGLISVFW